MTLIQPIMEKAVEDFREKPLDQRKADLRQIFRLYDLQDLKGAEFRRLLSLARDEGATSRTSARYRLSISPRGLCWSGDFKSATGT
jgi:hypothetical protein